MKTEYKNRWYNPKNDDYGKQTFKTDVKPTKYKGYLIYQRVSGHVWDIVKDNICISQRAGINGAKSFIDSIKPDDLLKEINDSKTTPLKRTILKDIAHDQGFYFEIVENYQNVHWIIKPITSSTPDYKLTTNKKVTN
jgi:hypothetical protein